jgi:hypothetical protein
LKSTSDNEDKSSAVLALEQALGMGEATNEAVHD